VAKFNLAACYNSIGHDTAATILDDIVENNPKSFVAHLAVGSSYLGRGDAARAESLFNRVLEINPNSAEAHVNLGHIFRVQGDTTRALKHFRRALRIDPKSYKAYNQIGAVYLQQNRLEPAEANFRLAHRLNGAYVPAINNLASLYSRASRFTEAERLIARAIKLDRSDVGLYIAMGAIKIRKRQLHKALEFFNKAVDMEPTAPFAHYWRGMALKSLSRSQEAMAAFRTALQIDSSFAPALEQIKQMRP